MGDAEKQDLLNHVEEMKGKMRKRFRMVLAGVSAGTFAILVIFLARIETHDEGSDRGPASVQEEPPKTATEIIAQEFAGEIEKGNEPPLGSSEVKPMIPVNDPSLPDLHEDEKEESTENAAAPAEPKKERKPTATPVVAPALKTSTVKFTFDKGSTKVSKNLDKKKVMSYLGEKLNKANCWPSPASKAKSFKAVININKAGTLGKIQVSPSDKADGKIASCIKQKLGPSAKAFKPKNKTVAEITVHFKVAR